MLKIENNSHMLEITYKIAFLTFFKLFWPLLALSSSNKENNLNHLTNHTQVVQPNIFP